jgi:PAS domain S-box-containing protein
VTEHRKTQLQREKFFTISLDMLCIVDFEGRFLQLNPAWTQVLGYSLDELEGRAFMDFVHPDDRARTEAELERQGGAEDASRFENRYIAKGGQVRWISWTAAVDKENGLFYAVARDVTDRKALDQVKDEFISVVSHEIRTPLTSIRGSIGLLASHRLGDLTPQGQRLLDIAVANTDRLIRLINDVLDLERMQSGKAVLHKAWHRASALMEAALGTIGGVVAESEVSVGAAGGDCEVYGDGDRLIQVLTNLLSNAVKFSPPKGRVTLAVEGSGKGIEFRVADEGRGIPPQMLEEIFEPFAQVDSSDSREKGGTGLGLAICRTIALQHGGRIWAESTLGQGTTMVLSLPPNLS